MTMLDDAIAENLAAMKAANIARQKGRRNRRARLAARRAAGVRRRHAARIQYVTTKRGQA